MSGGWWAEPAVAPGVALCLTIIAAALATWSANSETIDYRTAVGIYSRAFGVAGCMIAAVMLMKILGFALAIFDLCVGCNIYSLGFAGRVCSSFLR